MCWNYSRPGACLIVCVLLAGGLAGCASVAGSAPVAEPTQNEQTRVDALYLNGLVYTAAGMEEAFATRGRDIVFVGSAQVAAKTLSARNTIDLGGRFVMPGIIDSHAHPGLVALIGDVQQVEQPLPTDSRENFFAALREYAVALKNEPFIVLGDWDVAMFLPEGPNKAQLDAIFPDQPVVLTDNSGHSSWLNSQALTAFGVSKDTEDLSAGVSVFVRDAAGEPTGWVKEFALMRQLGASLLRPAGEIEARMAHYLGYLHAHGVTALWDAGNFALDDEIYSVLAEMDATGTLPVLYEASFHIFEPAQINIAISELKRLRQAYGGERLRFNSIKVHYDGVVEVGTAGVHEPYAIGAGNRGGFLFTAPQLADFLLALNKEDIDLHLHSVGDRATSEILDAVQLVRDQGETLTIEVTISHLEYVAKKDFARFNELGVHANFTPHWWGGTYFGDAGRRYVGDERLFGSQPGGELVRHNANVTFSSDVTTMASITRANPFVGLQMALTRQEYDQGVTAPVYGPKSNRVTREQAIAAYTLGGARQLGQEAELGSMDVGKRADFIVLPQSLFETDTYEIKDIRPDAVFLNGELSVGSL